MNRIHQKTCGFTLVELLVVVAIISVLAAIAIPQFRNISNKSKRSDAVITINFVHKVQMTYFGDHGYFWNGCDPGDVSCRSWVPAEKPNMMAFNEQMGLGAVLNTKTGWRFYYRFGSKPEDKDSTWYRFTLYSNFDEDVIEDVLCLHQNNPPSHLDQTCKDASGIMFPEGIVNLRCDDITNIGNCDL